MQITSFVAVVKIAPGVQAESGNPLCAIHPDVLVCTPKFGVPPVIVVPAMGLPGGVMLIVTELHPLNATKSAAITSSVYTYFFMMTVLLK